MPNLNPIRILERCGGKHAIPRASEAAVPSVLGINQLMEALNYTYLVIRLPCTVPMDHPNNKQQTLLSLGNSQDMLQLDRHWRTNGKDSESVDGVGPTSSPTAASCLATRGEEGRGGAKELRSKRVRLKAYISLGTSLSRQFCS